MLKTHLVCIGLVGATIAAGQAKLPWRDSFSPNKSSLTDFVLIAIDKR